MTVLLEQHFDIALETSDGIKKLRELILSLAMQGMLVPQDPNDQPASELLKEIEAKKKKLIKEGKIKKQISLPIIKENEIPYEIPQTWAWVRLNEIFDVRDGTHDTPKYIKVGIPLITSKNIYSGILSFDDVKFISEEDHCIIKQRSNVEPCDILFAMIGSIGNPVIVDTNREFSIKNVALFKYYYRDLTYYKFLHKFLLYSQYHMKTVSSGAVQSFVSLSFLRNYLFPLPPVKEQRRIVSKIDQLMALCDKLEAERNERNNKRRKVHSAAIKQLLSASDKQGFNKSWNFITKNFNELYSVPENVNELKKAILQLGIMGKLVPQDPNDQPASELLKEIEAEKKRLVKEKVIKKFETSAAIKDDEIPYGVPKGWIWTKLNKLVEIGTGSTPEKANGKFYNGTIPWYTSSATNDLIAKAPTTFITEKALRETNCKIFPIGSLIIALYGQGKTRGQISEIIIPGATNQALAAMVFNEASKPLKPYLKYYFQKIYTEIRSLAEGAAQPNLNVGKIKNTIIPLPPLGEQKRMVKKIDQLMGLCNNLEQQLNNSTGKQAAILNAVLAKI